VYVTLAFLVLFFSVGMHVPTQKKKRFLNYIWYKQMVSNTAVSLMFLLD